MTETPPLEIKGIAISTVSLILHVDDLSKLEIFLVQKFGKRAAFFEGEPTVLDLQQVPAMSNIVGLIELIRRFGWVPIAVRQATAAQAAVAASQGLAVLDAPDDAEEPATVSTEPDPKQSALPFDTPDAEIPQKTVSKTKRSLEPMVQLEAGDDRKASSVPPEEKPRRAAQVVSKPLRSGQQVYAKGRDLIVLAPVSFGAEVIADGNIHVYSTLRGRALAGVSGDRSARIYALSMQAELLSIAGVYRLFETPLPTALRERPVQVMLNDSDQITVALIDP